MKKYVFIAALLLCLASCQREVQPRVYGRYVPERKDDFAWENEYAAFRMYGPALRPENPSNGVDLWVKTSPELIVDTFYYREHVLGLPYHVNYGKGLDCYKVAHTCGAGGLVVIAGGNICVGGPYDRWEILEQTPDKFVFRLEYDSLPVNGNILQEQITITAEAGKMLNKAEVVLTCPRLTAFGDTLWVGGGIYLHDEKGAVYTCDHCGIIAYAEEAMSDPTAAKMNYEYYCSTSQGRSYIAVVTPHGGWQGIKDGTLFSVQPYQLGDTLTYFFGACWSEWSNDSISFPTDESWFDAIHI